MKSCKKNSNQAKLTKRFPKASLTSKREEAKAHDPTPQAESNEYKKFTRMSAALIIVSKNNSDKQTERKKKLQLTTFKFTS